MKDKKVHMKKVTTAGGGTIILGFFALLFGMLGILLEPAAKALYPVIFDGKSLEKLFSDDWVGYLEVCMPSVAIFVISLVMLFNLFGSVKKANAGSFSITLIIFIGVSNILTPVYHIVNLMNNSSFMDEIKKGGYWTFTGTCQILVYGLPAISAFFLLLAGLALAGRLVDSDIEVNVSPIVAANTDNDIQNTNVNADMNYSNVNDNGFSMPEAEPVVANVLAAPSQQAAEEINTEESANKAEDTSEVLFENTEVSDGNAGEDLEVSAVKAKFCGKCGMKIEKDNAKFCPKCGEKLTNT